MIFCRQLLDLLLAETVLIIELMRRTVNVCPAAVLALALVASGCMSSPSTPTPATQVGNAMPEDQATASVYTPPSLTHPPPLKDGRVDQSQSTALTNYLKAHHLPLVGAQVLAAPDGEKQVILFGFVATDYGKGDAESKTRRYINNPAVTVDNRIKIEPSLANSKSGGSSPSQSADGSSLSDIQAYENQRYADQLQQQQQIYSYQNQGPSPMTMVVPFLGMFGGGGFGIGGGSISPAFGGGFGYPPRPVPVYPTSPSYPSYP